jgi:hypothetical protein
MKSQLIVFTVLLGLLTLISALGGSLNATEPYAEPDMEEELETPPSDGLNKEAFEEQEQDQGVPPQPEDEDKVVEGFDGDMWASAA